MNLIVNQTNYVLIKKKKIYNKVMQEQLGDNDTLLYWIYNESKSVIPERFIRTLKGKIYKETDSL